LDSLAAELVDTLTLTHEHDLQLLAVGVVVDVLSNALVDLVVLDWNVHSNTRFQVNDVVTQDIDLGLQVVNATLSLLQLLDQVQRRTLSLIELVLQFMDVCRGSFKIVLEGFFGRFHLCFMLSCNAELILDIILTTNGLGHLVDLVLELLALFVQPFNRIVHLVDLGGQLDALAFHLGLDFLDFGCVSLLKLGQLSLQLVDLVLALFVHLVDAGLVFALLFYQAFSE